MWPFSSNKVRDSEEGRRRGSFFGWLFGSKKKPAPMPYANGGQQLNKAKSILREKQRLDGRHFIPDDEEYSQASRSISAVQQSGVSRPVSAAASGKLYAGSGSGMLYGGSASGVLDFSESQPQKKLYEAPRMKSFKNLESTLAAVEEMPGVARKRNLDANQNDPKQATQYKRSTSSGLLLSTGPAAQDVPALSFTRSQSSKSAGKQEEGGLVGSLARSVSRKVLGESVQGTGRTRDGKLAFVPKSASKKALVETESIRFREDGKSTAKDWVGEARERREQEDAKIVRLRESVVRLKNEEVPTFKGSRTRRLVKEKYWQIKQNELIEKAIKDLERYEAGGGGGGGGGKS